MREEITVRHERTAFTGTDDYIRRREKYQAGQGNIEKQLYAKESISEIDRELLLKEDGLSQYVRIAGLWIFRSTDTIM